MEEKIVIEIVDKIPTSVEKKLKGIGDAAELSALKLERSRNATAISAEKLTRETTKNATELQRLAKASAQAESAILRLKNAQDRLAKSSTGSKSYGSSIMAGARSFMGAAGVIGVGISAKELVELGNEYVTIGNKIKVVTDSEVQHSQAMEQVFDIANRTRTSVIDTATAFQRLDLALKPLGASQEETLRMTETINKAFILGGASTQEAAGALRQLTQAFNAGKLAGDEYRSVSENAPIIMEALSKSLGKTKGELKEMSSEGKITSEVLRKALNEAIKTVDERFLKTNITMGQSVDILKNNLIKAMGDVENRSGIFTKISNFIVDISKNVDKLVIDLGGASEAATDLFKALTSIGDNNTIGGITLLRRTIQGVGFIFAYLADTVNGIKIAIIDLAKLTLKAFTTVSDTLIPGIIALSNGLEKIGMDVTALNESIIKFQGENFINKQAYVELDNLANSIANNKLAMEKWLDTVEEAEYKTSNLKLGKNALRPPGAGAGIGDSLLEGKSQKHLLGGIKNKPFEAETLVPSLLTKQINAMAEATSDFNRELQLEAEALQYVGSEQENMNKLLAFENKLLDANAYYLTPQMREAYLAKIESLRLMRIENEQLNKVMADTIGYQETLIAKFNVIQKGQYKSKGVTDNEAFMSLFGGQMAGTQTEYDLKLEQDEKFRSMLRERAKDDVKFKKYLADYELQQDSKRFQEKLGYAETFFSNLSTLQNSNSREMFELGKAAAIAEVTINGIQSISKVWATPGIHPIAAAALSASIGIMTAAQVSQIASTEMRGYESGGYTGDMGTKDVAGIVHGREFVVNAAATAKNRSTLEAMNSGKSVGNGIVVNIENYGTSKEFDVQMDEDTVRIIARDEMVKNVPDLVSSEVSNPNSKISKSLNRNTTLTRKR